MPLGKYYCDYCEKQFQDTPSARKRHLQGIHHQRARALWYDSHKEPLGSSVLHPSGSLARGICHHFVRTGVCKYGDTCRYFHPKPEMVNPNPVGSGANVGEMVQVPNLFANQLIGGSSFSGEMPRDHTPWGNLPPSLQPPPEGGYPPLPFVDWG
ncbi:zinc finger CCCH domain-containing protein 3 [Typha angustifolia]|uniref:zinc finger CCCH domain-containing protein 3 n=1 Tax=Typha angustifolia TaxID=59011 RepID=UPI003C2B2559